jgi:hypothetical protein
MTKETSMTSEDWVTFCSLFAGVVCFLLFAANGVMALFGKSATSAEQVVTQAKAMAPANAKAISVDDFTKLLDAMSKLTDSLAKAGPSLTALIGAILFFAIAAVSSGALKSAPPAPADQHAATTDQTKGQPSK